jgi:hypothetical protein
VPRRAAVDTFDDRRSHCFSAASHSNLGLLKDASDVLMLRPFGHCLYSIYEELGKTNDEFRNLCDYHSNVLFRAYQGNKDTNCQVPWLRLPEGYNVEVERAPEEDDRFNTASMYVFLDQILLYVLLTFCLLATLADLEPGFSRSATEQTSKCIPIPEFLASNFPMKASFSLFQFFQPNIQKPSPATILYSPQEPWTPRLF